MKPQAQPVPPESAILAASIELRHLRYFLAVAEELNFTRAARRLNVVQQTLGVAQLEDLLGLRLFERSTRPVQLTDAALGWLPYALEAVEAAERVYDAAGYLRDGHTSRLRVSLAATAAFPLTPMLLEAFRERHPQVALSTRHLDFADPNGGLLTGESEIAIVRPPFSADGLELLVIASEPRYVALSDRHPSRSGRVSASESASHRCRRRVGRTRPILAPAQLRQGHRHPALGGRHRLARRGAFTAGERVHHHRPGARRLDPLDPRRPVSSKEPTDSGNRSGPGCGTCARMHLAKASDAFRDPSTGARYEPGARSRARLRGAKASKGSASMQGALLAHAIPGRDHPLVHDCGRRRRADRIDSRLIVRPAEREAAARSSSGASGTGSPAIWIMRANGSKPRLLSRLPQNANGACLRRTAVASRSIAPRSASPPARPDG